MPKTADEPKVQALTDIVIPVNVDNKFTAVKVIIPDSAEISKVFIIFPFLYEKYKKI